MTNIRPITAALAITGLLSLACTGEVDDDDDWFLEGVELEDDSLHYVNVIGAITLNNGYAALGAKATAKFYSDEYTTLIASVDRQIGVDLAEEEETQEFDIGSHKVWLLPSTGGYTKVCVELRVDDSNYGEKFFKLGCINAS